MQQMIDEVEFDLKKTQTVRYATGGKPPGRNILTHMPGVIEPWHFAKSNFSDDLGPEMD